LYDDPICLIGQQCHDALDAVSGVNHRASNMATAISMCCRKCEVCTFHSAPYKSTTCCSRHFRKDRSWGPRPTSSTIKQLFSFHGAAPYHGYWSTTVSGPFTYKDMSSSRGCAGVPTDYRTVLNLTVSGGLSCSSHEYRRSCWCILLDH
jgi:hypothetical protein